MDFDVGFEKLKIAEWNGLVRGPCQLALPIQREEEIKEKVCVYTRIRKKRWKKKKEERKEKVYIQELERRDESKRKKKEKKKCT